MIIDLVYDIVYNAFQIISGYLFADFLAGIYHWIKDTYFSPFTPLIGKTFIWGSRLHHVRPRYVIEFSDRELFIDSAKWVGLWMFPLMFYTGCNPFLMSLFIVLSVNDIVHKYAHMIDIEKPFIINLLQKINVIQSDDEHRIHHIEPHESNYCPITPYVNKYLEKINFWRNIEKVVEFVTGIKPRDKVYDFVEDESYPAGIKFIET